MTTTTRAPRAGAAGAVLLTLCAGQFLMVLDSSVMNVSMATVAKDLGTTITGIQTAITLYTLVMASLMITGGKLGQILGRKRAFAIGCVIYGCGSFITAISPSLGVLLMGWSGLEGIGAALILPAIVALVASNFGRDERPRAYGLVASAGAIAVAVGPIVGGLFTTYLSWRWVFAGEVLIVLVLLVLARRMAEGERDTGVRARPGGDRALGARPRADRVRDPALGDLGVREAKAGSARLDRPVADDLAVARRRGRDLAVRPVGEPAARAGPRAARGSGDSAHTGAARRADLVLLSVLPAGRAVLRRAAVPLGRAGALRDRYGRAATAALDHADPGRRRHPEALPARVTAPGGADRLHRAVRRPGGDGGPARRGRGT